MDHLLVTAQERVRHFIAAHDELQLWDDTPIQSATNRVLYGERAGEPIVFKVFFRKARRWQEERALQWLAASSVVPKLYPYPSEEILVMQRLPGQMLWQAQKSLSAAALTGVYHQVGVGLARLVTYAAKPTAGDDWQNPYAPQDSFWSTSFPAYYDEILTTCHAALLRHQISQPALHASIRNLQAIRSAVLARPVFMHVDDIHGGNMLVDGEQFQGFIDFEMSRLGNDLYLLGATLQWASLVDSVQWLPIQAGYEEEQGAAFSTDMLEQLKLFAPFQNWCRFAWYWGKDEQPDWVWQGNVREKVLAQLVQTLDVVESVMSGSRA
ncbi:MAG: aminoglycoside phosphotransferase family protein [Caldilineaceae bacterium]|nr:aminoglycoside phosphotransferase family protein [Caldilineaceae bacterium]